MDGGDDEKRFICRYCDKEYPCGKSLGGHLRSHRTAQDRTGPPENDVTTKPKLSPPTLRENPKKTWRFSDSGGGAPPQVAERFCKECGKGFQSMKALCGHMACHSDKREVVVDSQSETDTTSGPRRGKRSKRLRYKTLDFNNSNSSMSLSIANGSSSVSEIEQEQQEEVAKCLMMLSRDSGYGYGYGYGYGKGLSSFAESSDNNSVVLDTNKNGIGFDPNSDSGYFRNGVKKAKARVFVDGSDRDCGFNKLKLKNKSGFESVNYYPVYGASRRIKDHELWEICHNKIENGTASIDESSKVVHKRTEFKNGCNFNSNNKTNGCCDSVCESGENSIEADSFSVPFHSSTKAKVNKNKSLSIKGYKKPSDQEFSGKGKKRIGAKKTKCHECPICFRGFKSGQALGGHKRSHFMGRSEDRTVVVLAKQQISGLLDLNLPAPDEEEDSGRGHAGFMAM